MVRHCSDVCIQKEQHFVFVSSLGNVRHLFVSFVGSISQEVTDSKFQIQLIIEFPVIKLLYGPGILLSGEERGLVSRTAAGNRAHETSCCRIFTVRCLFMRSSHKWDYKRHRKFLSKR